MTARYHPKHRRPTRTDRLLQRQPVLGPQRRRPQPVLETADFEEAAKDFEHNPWVDRTLPGPQVLRGLLTTADLPYGPGATCIRPLGDDEAWWSAWMEREGITRAEDAYEILAARDELESVGEVVRDWERDL